MEVAEQQRSTFSQRRKNRKKNKRQKVEKNRWAYLQKSNPRLDPRKVKRWTREP